MTQEQAARADGRRNGRVAQIENGDVPAQDAQSRFVAALGLIANFGDQMLKLA